MSFESLNTPTQSSSSWVSTWVSMGACIKHSAHLSILSMMGFLTSANALHRIRKCVCAMGNGGV